MRPTLLRAAELAVVTVGRKAPQAARSPAEALRTSPRAWMTAGCTSSARRTASASVTCCGGCCAASTDHGSHDERRYEQRDGPGLRTVQHTAHSAFLTADYLSLPITEASTTSTTGACAGGAINASATVSALARGARPTK